MQTVPDDSYAELRVLIALIKRKGDALRSKNSDSLLYHINEELKAELPKIVAALQGDDLTIRELVSLAIEENDGDWDLRDDITRHIQTLRSAGSRCTYYLIRLLDTSDNPYILHRTASAVAYIGPEAGEAADALGKVLRRSPGQRDDERASNSAGFALGCLGQSGHDVLCKALKDEDGDVRALASIFLKNIRGVARPAISCLIDALQNEAPSIRGNIGNGFVSMGSVGVPALVDLLETSSSPITEEVLSILAKIGAEARAAKMLVTKLLDNPNATIRTLAAETVCRIDPQNHQGTIELAEQLVRQEEEWLRDGTLQKIREYGHRETAVATLQTLSSSRQPQLNVRLRALTALNALEPDKADAALSRSEEMQWDVEGLQLKDKLLLFVEIVRLYEEGAKSYSEVARRLSTALSEGREEGTGSVVKSGVTRCIQDLTPFFAKVFGQPDLQLFETRNGHPAAPTKYCRTALDWINDLIKRNSMQAGSENQEASRKHRKS